MQARKLIAPIIAFIIGLCFIRFGVSGAGWIISAGIAAVITAICFYLPYFFHREHEDSPKGNQKKLFFKGETRLAASLQEAVIIVDQRLNMVHINPAAHALFPDIRASESIMSVSNNDKLQELVKRALDGDRPEPFIYQIYDPIERHIRVTGSILRPEPVLDEQSRAVIIFYDVTDLERAN